MELGCVADKYGFYMEVICNPAGIDHVIDAQIQKLENKYLKINNYYRSTYINT